MKGVREYYDKTAAEWAEDGYGDGAALPCLEEFLSLLPPGGRVLDLCCGAGYETGRIRARGFDALGLDFSGESLKIARSRNPDIPFHQGDMLEDYSHLGPVDGILLSAGLVHVETADLPLAFGQMAKVLRPGGLLLASVREGRGRLDEWSLREIDGERYDRNFIAHTLDELTGAAGGGFTFLRELPSDLAVWRQYLFRREGAERVRLLRAGAEHLPALAALERVCFPADPWSEGLFREALDSPRAHILLAAGEDGALLGYAVVSAVLDEGNLDNIAVAPDHRRRGVADALLGAVTAFGRGRLAFLTLEVRASNAPAIGLYEKHGFVPVGRRKNYYTDPREDAVLMTLDFDTGA